MTLDIGLALGERFKIATVWCILAVVLLAAVIYHGGTGVWYLGIIAAEFALFVILALTLLKPSTKISLIAMTAATVWLGNQIANMGWFTTSSDVGTNISLVSAVLNTFLLAMVAFFYLRPEGKVGITGKGTGWTISLFAFLIVIFYAVMKFSVDMTLLPQWGVGALSGGLWAFGIFLIALSSALFLMLGERAGEYHVFFMLSVVGLIISAIVAFYWGQALQIFQV